MNAKEIQYATERMLYALKNIGNIMSDLCQQKYAIEQELSDLNHELELSPLSASELTRLVLEQRRLLRERRAIKDELMMLESFKAFQSNNDKLKYSLVETVKDMNNTVGILRNRKYRAKSSRELKCCKG